MSDETAINAQGSASTSAASSPRTTVASLSRENSTTSFVDSPESSRGGVSRHKGKGSSRPSSKQFLDTLEVAGNAEGYVSDQMPGTVPLPRYPGAVNSKPLPPHRVARIANSFGVHVPAPHAMVHNSSFITRRSASAHSTARHTIRQTTATRLLLDVIPPDGLVEGNDLATSSRTGDPFSRRGKLMPLHTTLQGQLLAIAQEYHFPSTAGLLVNLLDARDNDSADDYIGPRLSDEVWAALWRPALKLDKEEQQRAFKPKRPFTPPSPESTDGNNDLLSPSTSHAEPSSAPADGDRTLRPFMIGRSGLTSPSTTTLASASSVTSFDSATSFPRSPSIFRSQRDRVQRSESQASASDTASITSSVRRVAAPQSIVGRIEFDIDLNKGRWYDLWAARKRAQPPPMTLSRRTSASRSASAASHRAQMVISPAESIPETPNSASLTAPFDLQASIALSSAGSEQSPSLAARLDLPSPPLGSLSELPSPNPEEHGTDEYAPLEDPTEEEGDVDEDDEGSTYEEELTRTAVLPSNSMGLTGEDEMSWRDLQSSDAPARPRSTQTPRTGEFEVNLEGEVSEEDPIGRPNDAETDLKEVMEIMSERQDTLESQNSAMTGTSAATSAASSTTSESSPAVIVPVLSSPIVLQVEKHGAQHENENEDKVGDGSDSDYPESPESMEPSAPIFPNESTRTRTIPPPLHLRVPSEQGADVRVQVLQASPFGSPETQTVSLGYLGGEGAATPDGLSPSSSLFPDAGDRSSIGSSSSAGDGDDYTSQIRLQKKLDSLERHIAEVSPKLLPEEPEYQTMASPRSTPRELLDRIAQHTPRFSAPAIPGTPQFFSQGFARPTPGQPLILSDQSNPNDGQQSPAIKASPSWPAVPFEHVANEMRVNRSTPPTPPGRPGSSISNAPPQSQRSSPVLDEPEAAPRKSLAPSEATSASSRPSVDSTSRTSVASSLTTPTATHNSISDRPATPAVLDPPPRTFSLPQPSSRFSDDSFLADALTTEEGQAALAAAGLPGANTAGTGTNPNTNPRISVKGFAKLFRSRSKSRDPTMRSSREIPPPVPNTSAQINTPRAPPLPPSPSASPSTSSTSITQPILPPMPEKRVPRAISPVAGKPISGPTPIGGSGLARPGHAREDSGSDPFHFDQPGGRPAPTPASPLERPTTPGGTPLPSFAAGEPGSAAIRGKRGILKGWGTSARPNSVRPVAAPPLTPPPAQHKQPGPPPSGSTSRSATPTDLQTLQEHARSGSTSSALSSRALKTHLNRESWVSVTEGANGSSAGSGNGPSPLTLASARKDSDSHSLMSINEHETTEFASVTTATQTRRGTVSSLRPPISPASTESSQGPRPSVDEVMTPRTSQFEIITPPPQPQRTLSTYDRI